MAGLVLVFNKITGGGLPRWLMPVAAGAAMLGYAIWSEMTWAARTVEGLPEGLELVETVEETVFWKPWTFIKPQATRFVAADRANSRRNPDAPDTVLIDLYLYARWQPVWRVPQLVNCGVPARADVSDEAFADPEGQADWVALDDLDPLIAAVCEA